MEIKKKRGRPRLNTHLIESGCSSRRQAVNTMYMFEGVHLLSVAATEIPDSDLLWFSDPVTCTAQSKNGILEQIGRMLLQDKLNQDDCIYITNLAITALKNDQTSRNIEKAIRRIRTAIKEEMNNPKSKVLRKQAEEAVLALYAMGFL